MKYGIIKVKRAFLYEENGVDVVDEVFFGWSVMWEDEGEWIEVWTHYGYRGWMERNLIEEKSREWMEEREKGREYVCGDTRVCGCDEGSAGAVADVGDAGTGVFCGENGGDGEWVLQGETGEWDQWVCAGGGIKKKTGFGSVFVGKIGREVFCGAGDSGGVVGREVSEEGCGVCEGVSWMPVPVGREGGGWD